MKKIFKSFAWMMALGLVFTACNQGKKQAASTEEAATETAMDYAMSMGMGWNLGNSMDAWENNDPEYTLEKVFEKAPK